jgi:hypothetical protein
MVANSIQNLPAFVDSGQHSIVTAPADTRPSPRMRNLIRRGSGSTSLLPAPVVALSCRGFRTLIIAFPFVVQADESGRRFSNLNESHAMVVIKITLNSSGWKAFEAPVSSLRALLVRVPCLLECPCFGRFHAKRFTWAWEFTRQFLIVHMKIRNIILHGHGASQASRVGPRVKEPGCSASNSLVFLGSFRPHTWAPL